MSTNGANDSLAVLVTQRLICDHTGVFCSENVYNQSAHGPCKAILDRTPLLEINTRTLHKHNHRRARGVIKLSDVEEWRDA